LLESVALAGGAATATEADITPADVPNASTVAALATTADNHFRPEMRDMIPT
jgi:hypothetical protein